jgi:hypothetical protein
VSIVGRYLGGYFEIRTRSTPITPYGNVGGLFTAYIIPAVTRGIQAACRVIRAESEHCVLLFCDRRFGSNGLG